MLNITRLFFFFLLFVTPFVSASDFLQYVKKSFCSKNDLLFKDPQSHFIIICEDKKTGEKILKLEKQLYEEFLKRFNSFAFWKNPVIVKIFPNYPSYAINSQFQSMRGYFLKGRDKGRDIRLIVSFNQPGLLEQIIPHETTHLFIHDLAKVDEINSSQNKQVLPLWVNEGLAQYFEFDQSLWYQYLEILKTAMDHDVQMEFIPFFSRTEYPDLNENYFFYVQSRVTIYFLLDQKNGAQRIRNYITTFRSSIKEGYRCLQLNFPEFNNSVLFETAFKDWIKSRMSNYQADMNFLIPKIKEEFQVPNPNNDIFKEIAMGFAAYQLHNRGRYEEAISLSLEALKMNSGFWASYHSIILSHLKMNQKEKALYYMGNFRKANQKGAIELSAELKVQNGQYLEALKEYENLLQISKENGFLVCLKMCEICISYLHDKNRALYYVKRAAEYIPKENV